MLLHFLQVKGHSIWTAKLLAKHAQTDMFVFLQLPQTSVFPRRGVIQTLLFVLICYIFLYEGPKSDLNHLDQPYFLNWQVFRVLIDWQRSRSHITPQLPSSPVKECPPPSHQMTSQIDNGKPTEWRISVGSTSRSLCPRRYKVSQSVILVSFAIRMSLVSSHHLFIIFRPWPIW